MEELFENSYDFEQVDKNPLSIKYDFVSSGEKEVPKRVILTNYNLSGLERYYNLGFGNITITDEGEEKISDMFHRPRYRGSSLGARNLHYDIA